MIEYAILLFAIAFLFGIGFMFIAGFKLLDGRPLFEILSYSYGLGVGLISIQLFLFSLMGIHWTIATITGFWIVILTFVFLTKKKILIGVFKSAQTGQEIYSRFDKLLALLIFLLFCFVSYEALLRPVLGWDAWAIWLMKSKIFFIDGKINPSIFKYVQSDYPVLVSLLGTYIYIFLQKVDDRIVQMVFSVFYICLGGVFYLNLRRYLTITWSLLFTFLLLSLQPLIRQAGRFDAGYADLPLAYYFFCSASLLVSYIYNKKRGIFLLFCAFLSFTPLVKNEGIIFITGIIALCLFYFRNKLAEIKIFPLVLLPIVFWNIFKIKTGLSLTSYISPAIPQIGRTLDILLAMAIEILNITRWGFVWILLISSILFVKKNKAVYLFLFLIVWQLLFYLVIYTESPIDPVAQLRNSFDRLLLQVVPLAVFCLALLTQHFEKELKILIGKVRL